jgi:hypothetical protein
MNAAFRQSLSSCFIVVVFFHLLPPPNRIASKQEGDKSNSQSWQGSQIKAFFGIKYEHVPYIPGCTVDFTYELKDDGFGTRITERVEMSDFDDFRMPWAAKLVGWLTYHFRRLAGRTYLQRLNRVVERSAGN